MILLYWLCPQEWGGDLYGIFQPWFPFLQIGGSILQQELLLDNYRMFKLLGERYFGSVNYPVYRQVGIEALT